VFVRRLIDVGCCGNMLLIMAVLVGEVVSWVLNILQMLIIYEGRPINKLQNGIIQLIFKI